MILLLGLLSFQISKYVKMEETTVGLMLPSVSVVKCFSVFKRKESSVIDGMNRNSIYIWSGSLDIFACLHKSILKRSQTLIIIGIWIKSHQRKMWRWVSRHFWVKAGFSCNFTLSLKEKLQKEHRWEISERFLLLVDRSLVEDTQGIRTESMRMSPWKR